MSVTSLRNWQKCKVVDRVLSHLLILVLCVGAVSCVELRAELITCA